jgi:hypothetical protein
MTAARGGGFVGSRRAAGLPDLFLLHDDPPRMIIAEVKGPKGKLSDRQQEFLRLAREVADGCYCYPPEDAKGNPTADRSTAYMEHLVGVYAWTPADESVIEDILRSKAVT